MAGRALKVALIFARLVDVAPAEDELVASEGLTAVEPAPTAVSRLVMSKVDISRSERYLVELPA